MASAKKALDEIENNIKFTPEWGKERLYNMIRDRGDWCISRQRVWGVPIPVFYCEDCGETILDDDTIASVQKHVREHGTNCWFAMSADELLPESYKCPKCGGTHFRKMVSGIVRAVCGFILRFFTPGEVRTPAYCG